MLKELKEVIDKRISAKIFDSSTDGSAEMAYHYFHEAKKDFAAKIEGKKWSLNSGELTGVGYTSELNSYILDNYNKIDSFEIEE